MCVLANLEYLSILFCAVFWAAAPGLVAVLPMWDSAYVSGTVTSQAIGFPLAHGRRVVPSGRLLSSRIRLIGSFGIWARLIALHRMSCKWLWRCCLETLLRQDYYNYYYRPIAQHLLVVLCVAPSGDITLAFCHLLLYVGFFMPKSFKFMCRRIPPSGLQAKVNDGTAEFFLTCSVNPSSTTLLLSE